MTHDIFISYSTKDKTIADAVCAKLEGNNIRAWIAPRDVPPGTNFAEAIVNAISEAKVFVLIWSGNANDSKHILNEINRAFDQGVPIIPFRIQDVQPSSAMSYFLSNTHWLDAYQPSWKVHINKLISSVEAILNSESEEEILKAIQNGGKRTIKPMLLGLGGAALALLAVWFGLVQLNLFGLFPSSPQPSITQSSELNLIGVTETLEIPPTQTAAATATLEPEPDPCQIVFQSIRDGVKNLWLVEPDGANLTQLTFSQESDLVGSWTQDGAEFVFSSLRDGDSEIYIMDVNGSNIRQLTNNDSNDVMPKLSPDGTKIAFLSDRPGNYEVFMMDRNGENIKQLTTDYGWYGYHEYYLVYSSLDWAPDSQRLVFISDREGDPDLFTMFNLSEGDNDRDNMNYLSDAGAPGSWEQHPAWSPDGSKIAYVSDRYGDFEIFLFYTDGSGISQLTSNNGISIRPAWSPDGTKIAFQSDRTGDPEIWIMDADGSNQQQVTDSEGYDGAPLWSPLCWQ